jgi:hypothetical protein
MKLQKMIDMVKKHHPELGNVEIIEMLNQASDEFCQRTLVLDEATQFTTVSGQRYYGLKDGILEIKSVDLRDEDGNADHFGRQIALDGTVTDTTNTTALMDEQSELPEQFHQYLIDKAIQLGYEQKPEMIQMAPYFEKKFEKGIKEGKAFKNRNRISGMRHVRQSSY